jgi:hypothetical protein
MYFSGMYRILFFVVWFFNAFTFFFEEWQFASMVTLSVSFYLTAVWCLFTFFPL